MKNIPAIDGRAHRDMNIAALCGACRRMAEKALA